MAKVLLVEDDNNLREIYEARLQAEGYDIVSARDGEEALVVAKQEHPDLVVSDVMMPKISGFEMLDILRNTEGLKTVKVIMLTALGQAEDQTRADSLGADRYLVKSQVTLEDIVNAAQDLLTESGALPPAEPAAAPTPPAAVPALVAATVTDTPVAQPPASVPTPDASVAAPAIPEPVTPNLAPVAVSPAPEPVTPAVIPVATAPAIAPEPAAAVSMPPTAESTVPDEITNADPATPVANPANDTAVADSSLPAAPSDPETPASVQPQTEAQEAADVEQQIESFVATQSGTPAPEAVVPGVTSEAVTDAVASEEPTPVTAPSPAAPDQLPTTSPEQQQALDEAVANLGGTETDAAVAPPEAPTHKKVIVPLADAASDAPPKKSLEQLLAEEEAGQANPAPAAPSAPAANKGDFDPNSIAL